jgi:tetratricopeptide (TPR) repeat protein
MRPLPRREQKAEAYIAFGGSTSSVNLACPSNPVDEDQPMTTTLIRLLAAGALLLAATRGFANDSGPSPAAAPDKLASVRAQIAARNWSAAIAELKRINDTGDADWNNLMGYSLRKSPTPDLAGAERFYDQALRIDPRHRGALEYSGELYLMTGELAKAEQRLATLDKLCTFGCEEFSELKKAIARYKAGGKGSSTY